MLIFCFLLGTANGGNAQAPTFQIRADPVVSDQFPKAEVNVSVTNMQGMPLLNLTKKDFTLAEDGKPLTEFDVASILNPDQPISIMFAIDTGASMATTQYAAPLQDTVEAVKSMLKNLGTREQVGLITFSSKVTVVRELTTDRVGIQTSLDRLSATGYTAMYDAVVKGVELLKGVSERRVLVVITNYFDYPPSTYTDLEAIAEAQRWGVPIMVIGFGQNVNKPILEKLSNSSGGTALITGDSSGLKAGLANLLQNLRQQYRLRFVSKLPADAKEHVLTIGATFQSFTGETKIGILAKPQEVKVTLAGFSNDQVVGGKLKFAPVAVSPAPPIKKMELLVDGQSVDSSSNAPFDLAWDATRASVGSHELTFNAVDASDNIGQLKIRLTVRPPVIVKLASPASGSEVKGTIPVEAQIDSIESISKVEFYINGRLLQSVTAGPYKFDWETGKTQAGDYTLTATAFDVNGYSATSDKVEVRVILQNDFGLGFIVALVALAGLLIIIPLAIRSRGKKFRGSVQPGGGVSASLPGIGGQAVLVQTDASSPGTIWPLVAGEVRLGRKRDENDIPLVSTRASRRHAVIRQVAGQSIVYSLNTENSVLVNGVNVQQQVLRAGDELQLGDQTFRFELRS
jgi:VWFA-related protein